MNHQTIPCARLSETMTLADPITFNGTALTIAELAAAPLDGKEGRLSPPLFSPCLRAYTRGPVGVCEISSTISPTAFSLAPIATSACARTPTSLLSSSTTGRRRTW